MKKNDQTPAQVLVDTISRIYNQGLTTMSGGNLTIQEANGDVWITPSHVDKQNLTTEDIVLVKADGTAVGKHPASSELPVHQAVLRNEAYHAALHAHPAGMIGFSAMRRIPNTRLVARVAENLDGKIAIAPFASPGSAALAASVGTALTAPIKVALLENHGLFVGETDILKAYYLMEQMEYSCNLEANARRLGGTIHELTDEQLAAARAYRAPKLPEVPAQPWSDQVQEAAKTMCKLMKRIQGRKISVEGFTTYSVRLGEDTFLFTPANCDSLYLQPEDMVLVQGGKAEAGKQVGDGYELHMAVYEKAQNRDVLDSVITTVPQYLMAYGVTDQVCSSRLLPEAYVMVQDCLKVPFGVGKAYFEELAAQVDTYHTSALIQNYGYMVAGFDMLNAYDKLEVGESTAQALVLTKSVGEPVLFTEQEMEEFQGVVGMVEAGERANRAK